MSCLTPFKTGSKENSILKDILNATITIKCPDGRRVTVTPLAYAILRKDSMAVEKMLRVAKENGILKDILDATTTIKYPDGQEETCTPLAYAILRKDSIAVEKMLRVAKENGILKDILNTTITIKHKNNQKVTDKLLAALHDRKVIQKILDIARENDILKDILNATITIKYPDSEEKIYTPLTYTISCKSNEAFNTTRAINQDGQEKTHIPFPTLDKRETELKLKEKRQSRRDEGLNFNNGSSDKNVEIKVNGDILLQHSSGIENEINHTAVRNDVRGVKPLIESRVNVKVQNINAVIATSVTFKMIATSVTLELVASKITCVLSKPTTKLEEVAITYFQGLALYL
ncbi:WD_0033/WD_0034 family tandem repeat-containing protein [Wolbachia endosymbiont (group A) of Lasioglossum malachurum]